MLLLRLFSGCVGLVSLYAALFMYEDEEGRWQSRIERLWIAVSDRSALAGSQFAALFIKVAEAVNFGFDRIFGPRLFSIRMVGASTSCSLASTLIGLSLINRNNGQMIVLGGVQVSGETLILLCAAICVVVAVLPTVFSSRWLVALSLLPLTFVLVYFLEKISVSIRQHRTPDAMIALVISLPLSIASDIFLTALARWLVRYIASAANVGRVVLAIAVQVVCTLVFVAGPILLVAYLQAKKVNLGGIFSRTLEFVTAFNVFSGILCFAFVTALLVVLAHRVAWPILGRLLYPLARYEVARNRKILSTVSVACLMYAFDLEPSALKSIFQILGK